MSDSPLWLGQLAAQLPLRRGHVADGGGALHKGARAAGELVSRQRARAGPCHRDVGVRAHGARDARGSVLDMRARERPHVILDAAGELAYFLSGVGDPGAGGNTGVRGADHSYTLIQAVAPA